RDSPGRRSRPQAQGDVTDGADVPRDVLADEAVAPRGAPDQHAVLVQQRDGQAVDLQLDHVAGLADLGDDAGVAVLPGAQLGFVERVVQRVHGRQVPNFLEL